MAALVPPLEVEDTPRSDHIFHSAKEAALRCQRDEFDARRSWSAWEGVIIRHGRQSGGKAKIPWWERGLRSWRLSCLAWPVECGGWKQLVVEMAAGCFELIETSKGQGGLRHGVVRNVKELWKLNGSKLDRMERC